MKLNLERYNCKVLTVSSDLKVSVDIDRQLLDFLAGVSHSDDEHGIPNNALFLSQFKTVETIEQSLGRLQRFKTDEEVRYHLQIGNTIDEQELSRPSSIKPVLSLIGAASALLGPINVRCYAEFDYDRAAGYSSRIPLPAPMVSPFQDTITQIEGYQLSYLEADDKRYSISLRYSDEENTISHIIRCNFTDRLNQGAIRGLRKHSTAISKSLIMQTKDRTW